VRVALSLLTIAALVGGLVFGCLLLFGGLGGVDPADLVERASALHEERRYEESAALYLQASELWEAEGDERQALAARAQRGVCLKMAGRLDEARSVLEAALAEARSRSDLASSGLALGNLAKIEALSGQLEASLRHLDALAAVAQEGHDERTEILTREQAALLADSLGRHADAVERFETALQRHAALDLGVDDRRDALRRQMAWAQVELGDDLGARASWDAAAPGPAGLARQAEQLALLGLHARSAEVALSASKALQQEQDRHDDAADRALELGFGQLLASYQSGLAQTELAGLLPTLADPRRRAPFELLAARCLLVVAAHSDAAARAALAREGFGDDLRAQEAAWIEAIALVKAGRPDPALALLRQQPACLARTVLEGWIADAVPFADEFAFEALPLLDPDRLERDDESLALLQAISPEPLPELSLLALHLSLADADLLRRQGKPELADVRRAAGCVAALRWQALEARHRLLDRWPEAGALDDIGPRLLRWAAGELPADEAVIAVLPGPALSYLMYFRAGHGVTTFALSPAGFLDDRMMACVAALRANDMEAVVSSSYALFTSLFPEAAQVDLRLVPHWTLLLPDLLVGVPPAMWVSEPSEPGEIVPWVLRAHDVRLMPFVLPEPLAHGLVPSSAWTQFGAPALSDAAPVLVAEYLDEVYGVRELPRLSLRAREPAAVSGAAASVPALLELLARPGLVEVTAPGFGGGRLGGLLLAPAPGAARGDAAAGFLPWHRLAEVPIAADLLLDGTRFIPDDPLHGPQHAATAAFTGGARQLALLRWPLPTPLQWGMVDRIEHLADGTRTLAELVCHSQRLYIAGAEQAGEIDRTHPRVWAGWLVFDAGP